MIKAKKQRPTFNQVLKTLKKAKTEAKWLANAYEIWNHLSDSSHADAEDDAAYMLDRINSLISDLEHRAGEKPPMWGKKRK